MLGVMYVVYAAGLALEWGAGVCCGGSCSAHKISFNVPKLQDCLLSIPKSSTFFLSRARCHRCQLWQWQWQRGAVTARPQCNQQVYDSATRRLDPRYR